MATEVTSNALSTMVTTEVEPRVTTSAQYLGNISRAVFHMINERDFTNPWWHLYFRRDFKTCKDWGVVAESIDEFLHQCRLHSARYPNGLLEPMSVVADIDEGGNTAKVWVTLKVAGVSPTICQESVSTLSWRRGGHNQWKCHQMWTVRPFSPTPA